MALVPAPRTIGFTSSWAFPGPRIEVRREILNQRLLSFSFIQVGDRGVRIIAVAKLSVKFSYINTEYNLRYFLSLLTEFCKMQKETVSRAA